MTNNLYRASATVVLPSASNATEKAPSQPRTLEKCPVAASAMAEDFDYWIWHARLGHPGEYQLGQLEKSGVTTYLSIIRGDAQIGQSIM